MSFKKGDVVKVIKDNWNKNVLGEIIKKSTAIRLHKELIDWETLPEEFHYIDLEHTTIYYISSLCLPDCFLNQPFFAEEELQKATTREAFLYYVVGKDALIRGAL